MNFTDTHDVFDDCLTHETCRRCKCEGSELAGVECGDTEGLTVFRNERTKAFNRQLYEAEIHVALAGQRPLSDKRKAPALKRMMMIRFKQMTGKEWDSVKP